MTYLFAYMTADRVDLDSEDYNNIESGYIDPNWSMIELFPSVNDVSMLMAVNLDDITEEELTQQIQETIDEWLGVYEYANEGILRGADEKLEMQRPYAWIYYLVFQVKYVRVDNGQYEVRPFDVSNYLKDGK